MKNVPLMPKATAVWLVENTSLTFEQIAEFCNLHPLEVKGIADGEVATGIKGLSPLLSGQLTREEITVGEKNSTHALKIASPKVRIPPPKRSRHARYTPLSRRQDRPNGILWLLRNHPELKDAQVIRLIGTTKATLTAVQDRTHWNSPNLTPMDPVTLGICSQMDLDMEVRKARKEKPMAETAPVQSLVSADVFLRSSEIKDEDFEESFNKRIVPKESENIPDIESVFGAKKDASAPTTKTLEEMQEEKDPHG